MRRWVLVPLSALAIASASCPAPDGLREAIATRVAREPRLAAVLPGLAAEGVAAAAVRPIAAEPAPAAAEDDEPTAGAPGAAPSVDEGDGGEADDWGLEQADALDAIEQAADEDLDADEGLEGEVALEDEPSDAEADDDAAVAPTAPPTDGAPDPAGPFLASIARETWIYAEPRFKSRRIGYLRAGAVVRRDAEPVATGKRCKAGWYRVEPRGFVCAERTATLDVHHPVVEASRVRPRVEGLPYGYAMSRTPTPPLYARLPSDDEQRQAEGDLAGHLRKIGRLASNADFVPLPEPEAMPPALLYGQALPGLADQPERGDRWLLGHARIRSGFAILSQFDHDGRRFGVTADLFAIPLDRTRWVKPSTFRGVKLDGETGLPIAFVTRRRATRFTVDESGRRRAGEPLAHREAVPLTGRAEGHFLEAKDGTWVRAEDVVKIDRFTQRPSWAMGERRWIDVSILKQALVAYEGERPVYATLVSTGRDGIGDPEETHSTIQGTFLVHTKHVTVTMDGDDAGDEFDLRDVPWVQYFTAGYALHAAYWHDDFGTPRSHGCVNLAPLDASFLFAWTDPVVPEGWHAALSLTKGTLIHTHP